MKAIIFIGMLALASPVLAQSDHYVRGYTRSDGTYVQPHYQTNPDSTKLNNYSTQGNVNPYTGQPGTVNPYAVTPSNPYGSPYNSGYKNPYDPN